MIDVFLYVLEVVITASSYASFLRNLCTNMHSDLTTLHFSLLPILSPAHSNRNLFFFLENIFDVFFMARYCMLKKTVY